MTTPAPKKATAKRSAAKKLTTRTKRAPAKPMPKEVREAASSALMAFEERLLEHEDIGFTGSSTRELKGARSGMVKAVRFEDSSGAKHRSSITVAYR